MSTFCEGVKRSSPRPYDVGEPCELEELIARDPSHRRLQPHVVQTRLPLAEDADVVARALAARVAARRGQRAAQPLLELGAESRRPPLGDQEGEP